MLCAQTHIHTHTSSFIRYSAAQEIRNTILRVDGCSIRTPDICAYRFLAAVAAAADFLVRWSSIQTWWIPMSATSLNEHKPHCESYRSHANWYSTRIISNSMWTHTVQCESLPFAYAEWCGRTMFPFKMNKYELKKK